MADKIRDTKSSTLGPWLLDSKTLKEFDEILDKEWDRLMAYRADQIDKVAQRELRLWQARQTEKPKKSELEAQELQIKKQIGQRYGFKAERTLTVKLKKDERIEVASFSEAIRHPSCIDDSPDGFSLNLECVNVRCTIKLPGGFGFSGPAIELSAQPDSLQEAQELFTVLQSWIVDNGPSRVQKAWLIFAEWKVIAIVPAFLWISSRLTSDGNSSRYQNRVQADELVKGGISEQEIPKALETLLLLQAELKPKIEPPVRTTQDWFFPVSLVVMFFVLSFAPRVVLGIGRGEKKIHLWRTWGKWMFVVVPGWLFANILGPKLVEVIKSLSN